MKNKINIILIFTISFLQSLAQQDNTSDDIVLEFDEKDIRNLNLNIKWSFKPGVNRTPTRFVLLVETKRINLSTFLFDYSSPELIDDESVVKASAMKAENFKKRVPVYHQSSIDCAINCINSTKFSKDGVFDCNIFYYDSSTRTCVLYEYDFKNNYKTKRNFLFNDIYDYFNDDCDMDEILGDVVGYSKLCRRILDYKDNHVVKINPFIDYRFSISIRDEKNVWTPYLKKEYQYTPKITIDVKGDIKIGNNITLECKTELSPAIVDSITWKNNNPAFKGVLKITPLTLNNIHQTFFCEIRFNFFRMIQKAYKLNITGLGDLKPNLKINYNADIENLKVNLNWNVSAPFGSKFKPEKIILLYSENNQPYKFVNKYLLFELSKSDYTKFANPREFEELVTTNEDECAMNCLLKSFCDHFVFIRSIEPYRNSKRKNCRLASKNYDSIFPCRYDQICATLSSFDKNIHNDSLNILILPNITYKFKIQLKDKNLNWTDVEETGPIFLPLKIAIEQKGAPVITENNSESKFLLFCNTNINREVQNQISWIKDDKELFPDNFYFTQYDSKDSSFANSVLEFKINKDTRSGNFSGIYKCKIHVRYPEVGEGTSYLSDPKQVDLSFSEPLRYNQTISNITLPTIPGILFEASCQIYGNPVKSLKWLVDGVNYNDRNNFPDNDDPFIINIKDNSSYINNILVIKLDHSKPTTKYECILNDNITVRSHYITILDEKPELEINIDKSNLNKFQLSIDLKVKNSLMSPEYKNIDVKPIKFSILYVENSTFNEAYQTIVAPDTISNSNTSKTSLLSDRITLGRLKPTQHGIQSCKLLCFKIPFCKSYEYLMFDDSCNLYSNSKMDTYYNNLINNIKSSSQDSNFNLIHLLQGDLLNTLEEDLIFNNTILIDKKVYPNCELKSNELIDDLRCSDDIADFNDKYLFDNLVPSTSYQFRIEIVNAFGKSTPYVTELIDIPFPLNPIIEHEIGSNQQNLYSLECNTPLTDTRKLQFKWYRNQELIQLNDSNYKQIINQTKDNNQGSLFSSELLFQTDPKKLNGLYTCSLSYVDDNIYITKNESFIFKPTIIPSYQIYENANIIKQVGDMWSDSCSVTGWPLPQVEWYFKSNPISNQVDNSLSSPYTINHHRNNTVSSYIIAQNLSVNSEGLYSCMLNGKIAIKNITLKIFSNQDKNSNNDTSSTSDLTGHKNESNKLYIIPIIAIIIIASFVSLSIFIYFKRKRSNSDTLLTYNRIEEELMTGVDNVNLTEDNQ